MKADAAVVDGVDAMGQPQGYGLNLIGQKHGRAALFQAHDLLFEHTGDQWRQAFGRFVEQDQVRAGHQRPPDGEHLLLAAAQKFGPARIDITQSRKKLVASFLGPGIRTIFSSFGNFQVFIDRQIGKDPPIVRDITDSPASHHIRFLPRAICAFEFDGAFARRRNAIMLFMVVLLPAPFRPSKQTILLAATSRDTPNRMWLNP
jgi:hypothetical protein